MNSFSYQTQIYPGVCQATFLKLYHYNKLNSPGMITLSTTLISSKARASCRIHIMHIAMNEDLVALKMRGIIETMRYFLA